MVIVSRNILMIVSEDRERRQPPCRKLHDLPFYMPFPPALSKKNEQHHMKQNKKTNVKFCFDIDLYLFYRISERRKEVGEVMQLL